MRETLHQLTLTLALPISVVTVWVVRGEPAGTAALETASAYRVELADLPLPTRERLRTPGEAFDWRAPRVTPEDPTPRHRRLALPNQFPPPPVDLADDASPETAVAVPPSPRDGQEPPGAVPRAPLPALSDAPALVAAAPSVVSRRGASGSTGVAPTVSATVSTVPAESKTGSSAAKTAVQTITGSSATKGVAQSSTGTSSAHPPAQSSTGSSVARALVQTSSGKSVANENSTGVLPSQSDSSPVPAAAPEPAPGPLRRDWEPEIFNQPDSIPDRTIPNHGWNPAKDPTRGPDPVESARNLPEQFPNPIGHAPLMPPGRPADPPIGLSRKPDSPEPELEWPDLPLPAPASAAAHGFSDPSEDFSTPDSIPFGWNASWPTAFVMIPEPGSALLLGAALAALGAARRRRPRA